MVTLTLAVAVGAAALVVVERFTGRADDERGEQLRRTVWGR